VYRPPNTPWIIYKSEYGMSSSTEMDQLSDQVPTMGLPEVVYGSNHVFFVNPQRNFLFELNPLDAVSLSSYAVRDAQLRPKDVSKFSVKASGDDKSINLIDVIPVKLEVQQTDFWKKRDTSKIKDFTKLEVFSDWTFSSPYKGSIRFLSSQIKRIKETTSLDLEPLLGPVDPEAEITVEYTDE